MDTSQPAIGPTSRELRSCPDGVPLPAGFGTTPHTFDPAVHATAGDPMIPVLMAQQVLSLTAIVIDTVAKLPQTPTRHELPSILVHTAGDHVGLLRARAQVRMLPHYASAFAATYCWRFNPAPAWAYAGPDLAAAVAALPAGATRSQQRVFAPGVPRLAWTSPEGSLIIDELRTTHYLDGLLDDWGRERLAADLALARAAFTDVFAGIRLLSLRTPERSLLITSPTDLLAPQVLSATALGSVGGWWR